MTVSKYLREERLASEVKQGAMIQISGIGAGAKPRAIREPPALKGDHASRARALVSG